MRIARRLQFLKLPIMVSIQLRRFHFLLTYLRDFTPPPWKAVPNCLFLPKYNWKTQRVVD